MDDLGIFLTFNSKKTKEIKYKLTFFNYTDNNIIIICFTVIWLIITCYLCLDINSDIIISKVKNNNNKSHSSPSL